MSITKNRLFVIVKLISIIVLSSFYVTIMLKNHFVSTKIFLYMFIKSNYSWILIFFNFCLGIFLSIFWRTLLIVCSF
jgi:hypothetical protein